MNNAKLLKINNSNFALESKTQETPDLRKLNTQKVENNSIQLKKASVELLILALINLHFWRYEIFFLDTKQKQTPFQTN